MSEVAVMQTSNEPAVLHMGVTAGFATAAGFELLQRMANMFSNSTLVPDQYKGAKNIGNCVIAMNMAQRMNADPLMVMQNLYVVYGQPSWSSKFMISMFNMCGRYSSIHYDETGEKGTDTWGCIAWATEKSTGKRLSGPEVTIGIAKKEGWYAKNGSKWQTMPEQMMRYRAAAWFIRTTAPELSMGLQTTDEVIDVTPDPVTAARREIHVNANVESFEAVNEIPKIVQENTEKCNKKPETVNETPKPVISKPAVSKPEQQAMPEF